MQGRNNRDNDAHWIPEKNVVSEFAFKGIFILFAFVIIGSLINRIFF
ncbi:MAG: hypothetical protein ABWY25_04760 [Paenisporosarcina sp.]